MVLVGKRKRLARGQGDQLRDEIIAATAELLVDAHSAEDVSIRAIADRVGVTPPAIYRHFPDKESLLFQTCLTKWEKFGQQVGPAFTNDGSSLDKLKALGIAYVKFAVEYPTDYAIMMTDWDVELPESVDKQHLPGMDVLVFGTQLIAQGIEAGEIRDVDPKSTMVALWAMVHGIASLSSNHSADIEALQDPMALADMAAELLDTSLRKL